MTKDKIVMGYDVGKETLAMLDANWPFDDGLSPQQPPNAAGRRMQSTEQAGAGFNAFRFMRAALDPEIRTSADIPELVQHWVRLLVSPAPPTAPGLTSHGSIYRPPYSPCCV